MPALVPLQDPTAYAAQVTRFTNQGEVQYSDAHPFLVDRVALNVVAGTSVYTLSDYVRSIKRVTWQGKKLDPLGHRNLRDVFGPATQRSEPFWYVFNNVGINKIQLFPVPSASVSNSGSTNLWGATDIAAMVIVEFWRVSDNSSFVIPAFNRAQMLKHFVNRQLYQMDGPGINLKASAYFANRWEQEKKSFSALLDDLHSKPRKLVVGAFASTANFPASPVLPIANFGVSVDEGS